MSTLFDVEEVIDTVIHGDALEIIKTLPDNCVDAIVCDPPAGINFMGKAWDDFSTAKPGQNNGGFFNHSGNARLGINTSKYDRDTFISFLSQVMAEAMRVLKPGGHCLVWSLPRTSHWTALALEDAGFEIRDNIYNIVSGDTALYNFIQSLSEEQQHAFMQVIDAQREPSGIMQIFGSGFPKNTDISKMLDKHLKADREIIGIREDIKGGPGTAIGSLQKSWLEHGGRKYEKGLSHDNNMNEHGGIPITAPSSDEAKRYSGYGTHLKPAVENWWLVRKPLAASSIAENVLEYGTGGLNIDATRVGWDKESLELDTKRRQSALTDIRGGSYGKAAGAIAGGYQGDATSPQGRFPSHLLLSHTLFCQQSGTKRVRGDGHKTQNPRITQNGTSIFGMGQPGIERARINDEDGMETVTNWECVDWCPIKILDLQSGTSKSRVSIRGKAGNAKFNGKYHNGETYTNTVDQLGGYSDSGGPSRYFQQFPALDDVPPYIYAGKASRRDRNTGCDGLPSLPSYTEDTPTPQRDNRKQVYQANTHPTVKSQQLMRYLVRLVTPPNGIVLDMFAGSGSTLCAAIHEGFHFIGIEKELEYITIARSRIEHAIATVGANLQPPPTAKPPTLLKPRHKTTNIQPTLWDREVSNERH